MKHAKKLAAFLLALAMVLAVNATAFAASITIQSPSDSEAATETTSYTYYQIFNASIKTPATGEASGGSVAYTIPAVGTNDAETTKMNALANAVDGLKADSQDLFTVTKSGDGTVYTVVLNKKSDDTDFTGEEIAAALNVDNIKNNALTTGTFAQTKPGGIAKADNLNPGYYLILSSLGTKLAVQTLSDVTINEKNEYPENTKTDDKETVSYGETVSYTVTVKIPANVAEKDITVVDTITPGLTMNTIEGAITVTGTKDGAGIGPLTWIKDSDVHADSADPTSAITGTVYKVVIPAEKVKVNAGQTLTLTYTATVNEKAVVKMPEHNKAYIEYDHYTTVDKDTEVVTHGFTVKKIDGGNVTNEMTNEEKLALTALDGAEFTLWTKDKSTEEGDAQIQVVALDASGNIIEPTDTSSTVAKYRVAQNDDEKAKAVAIKAGEATIDGLAAGTYYLQEDKAPAGYNSLTVRQQIIVSENTSVPGVDIAVENKAGSILPSTGGMGTTVFYTVGSILLVGAAVLLIVKRRMKDAK